MASFKKETPVSAVLKADDGSEMKKGRGDFRKEKDLEEERKAGTAPAMVDVDTGRDINPHIPQFISQNPWYVPSDGPTLKHQRPHPERMKIMAELDDWYQRGTTEKAATKFRKGACENCGAMTHKKKDCFERPRKANAKQTGTDIAPDDHVLPVLKLDFDAKRDRWNGYNPETHADVVREYSQLEEARKIIKAEKMKEENELGITADTEDREDEVENEDEDKYAEDADMAGVSVDMDSRTRITVRNLRIREDTAKYLYNLSENAPYYDPKSRSMRENPFQGVKGKEAEAAKFQGENFIRYSGEVVAANEAQVFAWNARCQGIDVHALAEPTKLAALKKQYKTEKSTVKEDTKKMLLEKYGGAEHFEALPKELLMSQTERYVEYSAKGRVLKGDDRPMAKSVYEEDEYPGNHSSIWGSYWHKGQWGYKCCKQLVKQAYCIPIKKTEDDSSEVKEAAAVKTEEVKTENASEVIPTSSIGVKEDIDIKDEPNEEEEEEEETDSEEERERQKEQEEEKRKRKEIEQRRERKREKRKRKKDRQSKREKNDKKRRRSSSSSSSSSEDSDSDEESKKKRELKKAIKEEKRARKKAREEAKLGERAMPYNSNYEVNAPTEAQMEAFNLTRIHASDPMASILK